MTETSRGYDPMDDPRNGPLRNIDWTDDANCGFVVAIGIFLLGAACCFCCMRGWHFIVNHHWMRHP